MDPSDLGDPSPREVLFDKQLLEAEAPRSSTSAADDQTALRSSIKDALQWLLDRQERKRSFSPI